jgi:hypothetical protein
MAKQQEDPAPNLAVRLDKETKEMLSIFAIALGRSEKEIAVEAIGAWFQKNSAVVVGRFNEIAKTFQKGSK